MRIVTARRISQVFFLVLFLWFCTVAQPGEQLWQLRGWPVNWLLELDPLVGLGTLLSTGTLYRGLLWGLLTVVLTLVLGRFFCGWVCPFGTIHQCVGYLGGRKRKVSEKLARNRYNRWQAAKYAVLLFLLSAAAGDLLRELLVLPRRAPLLWAVTAAAVVLGGMVWRRYRPRVAGRPAVMLLAAGAVAWGILGAAGIGGRLLTAGLQTGLLDPLPLLHRSVNLVWLPLAEADPPRLLPSLRFYQGAGLIAAVFLASVLLNLRVPRFYCRYVCPLGALFGWLGRSSLWRIARRNAACRDCSLCETACEGACSPAGRIRISECVLCMNCRDACPHGRMAYRMRPAAEAEEPMPDLSRRAVLAACAAGLGALPVLRLNGRLADNWTPDLVRPPGALAEDRFLNRCLKCGQCVRVCPTNVIQSAGLGAGLESLWTPRLNFRIGAGGCLPRCVACSQVCPTAALRPLSLDERLGRNRYSARGPLRIGTAFLDRGRCLPWAMERPCIVCQENCPVSPKAIEPRDVFRDVFAKRELRAVSADDGTVALEGMSLAGGALAGGDYFCRPADGGDDTRRRIVQNDSGSIVLAPARAGAPPLRPGERLVIELRLQQPWVVADRCIGCGFCEHVCPVAGKRAIRVTAENESRDPRHRMLIPTGDGGPGG